MKRLSRSDLEAVLDFAGEAAVAAREPERQDAWLLARIARLVESDMVKYCRVDASHRPHDVTVLGEPEPPPSDELLEVLSSGENPYSAHAARTGQPHFFATRLFDVVKRGMFRRTRIFQLIPFAEASSVQMRMPGHGGSLWKLEVLQLDREFTDRQLSLLDAVRPWLELYEERRVLGTQVAAIRAAPVDQERRGAAFGARAPSLGSAGGGGVEPGHRRRAVHLAGHGPQAPGEHLRQAQSNEPDGCPRKHGAHNVTFLNEEGPRSGDGNLNVVVTIA